MGKAADRAPRAQEPRDREKPLKVYVNREEREAIERLARSAKLSISDYLRTAGLNHTIRSTMDHQAVRELCHLHGDLGRVGGLLKLWLAEKRGEAVTPEQVDAAYRKMLDLQDQLRDKIERLG